MALDEPAVLVAADVDEVRHGLRVFARLHADHEHNQIRRDLELLAGELLVHRDQHAAAVLLVICGADLRLVVLLVHQEHRLDLG